MTKFITLTRRGRNGDWLGRVLISVDNIVDVREEADNFGRYSSVDVHGHGFVVTEKFEKILKMLCEVEE